MRAIFLPAAALDWRQSYSLPPPEYSPSDALERSYENQLALEAAVMELSLWSARNDEHLETLSDNSDAISPAW